MELTVLERLVLLNILPAEGNFATLKLVRQLREELSFDEEEHKLLSFVQDGEQVRWNLEVEVVKDCVIGEKMTDLIVGKLKELDKKGELKDDQFSLYEKFVEN